MQINAVCVKLCAQNYLLTNGNNGKDMAEDKKTLQDQIVEMYRDKVLGKHRDLVSAWPIISGYNTKIGTYRDWAIVIYEHTGASSLKINNGFGEITPAITGVEKITHANKNSVRGRIERHFKVDSYSAAILLEKKPDGNWDISNELDIMLQKHEFAMGVVPMRIFLSHKGADKPLVREFKTTLEMLGFSPWLDEDAMSAGAELERSILHGFSDSCAAIFFVTPNYKDENYLAAEVDYAIQEKRKKGDKFSIITLVFDHGDQKGNVPELLHRYVWKQPASHLEALREVLKALPIQTGDVSWKM